MAWFIGQSFVFIVVAFVVGVLVGWLWWGRRRPAPAVAADGATELLARPAPVADDEPTAALVLSPPPASPVVDDEPTAVLPVPVAAEPEPVAVEPEPEPVAAEPEPEPVAAEADSEPTVSIPLPAAAPEQESEPEPEPEPEPVDEDLERIEGIGPKMSAALRAAGIRSYAALAESDEATLRAAIERAGLNFAPSLVTWARQARLLADGDEEGFADLTRRLVAGRDTGRA